MRFTFVVAGWPGSVHDTRVLNDAQVEYSYFPHPPDGNNLYMHYYALIFCATIALTNWFWVSLL